MGHHHRAGSLRQSNKSHKAGSSSKRSLNRQAGAGRAKPTPSSRKGVSTATSLAGSKANRIHATQQRREKAKQQLLLEGRLGFTSNTNITQTVIVVGIIALSGDTAEEVASFEELVRNNIVSEASSKVVQNHHDNTCASISCRFDKTKHNSKVTLTLLTNSTAFQTCYFKDQHQLNDGTVDDAHDDAAIHAALDLVRVCDVVVFSLNGSISTKHDDGDAMMSERGERMLTALKAQGLPTPITALCFLKDDDISLKKKHKQRGEMKKYAQRMATTEFGQGAKLLEVNLLTKQQENYDDMDTNGDDPLLSKTMATPISQRADHNMMLVRTLCHSCLRPCKWAHMRSHMVSDGSSSDVQSFPGYSYNGDTKELAIQGYLRGHPPLDVNSLVHVPHMGTFAIKCVMDVVEPLLLLNNKKIQNKSHPHNNIINSKEIISNEDIFRMLVVSDPSKRREALDPYASPDVLEGEQNLIGFDNSDDESLDGDDQRADATFGSGPRPAGWSDYQASWLDALDDDNHTDESDEDDDDNVDHGELGAMLNVKKRFLPSSSGMMEDEDDEDDMSVASMERAALFEQRNKEHKKELDFPDEVELKKDELARERFDRYRSLKSFRKSHWDPKENLPESHANIYHFASFKATQHDVLSEVKCITDAANTARLESGWKAGTPEDAPEHDDNDVEMDGKREDVKRKELLDGYVASGSYVRVILEGVPESAFNLFPKNALLSMVSLMSHENKISVLHMGVCQTSTCEPGKIAAKSKDLLTFRCGWRTWQGRPIFSQNNLNSDKHKFERFLPANAFVAVSVYGPVSYTPCPVLIFREPSKDNSRRQLVALGSMIGADADRVVIKRVVLTGYPVRVHKRHATVKYMFFNPDDVKWFKPAGLTSKHGLQGHIMESVGEHGTMKCLFNQPIKQHDTVCLPLYKRVYPKYANVMNADGNGYDKDGELIIM